MKAILEFYLPEDQEEYDTARRGAAYLAVLRDLKEVLRSTLKYNPPKNKAAHDALNGVYEKLFTLLDGYGVTLD